MNKFEHYLVDLLQHKITYNDEIVQVRRQFNDIEQLPCITLSVEGVATEKVYAMKTGTSEEAQYERRTTIDINVWCNTEEERESITDQVMQCFYREQAGHYTYCSQYEEGLCLSLNAQCPVPRRNSVRRMKEQCSQPEELHYEGLSEKYNLLDGTVNIESPVMMDEYDRHPPLLRSRFSSEASYYDTHSLLPSSVEQITYNEVETRQ